MLDQSRTARLSQANRCTLVIMGIRLLLTMSLVLTVLLPQAGSLLRSIPMVQPAHASASDPLPGLRLPWRTGTYGVGGNGYGCNDHTGPDQYALDFNLPPNTPVAAAFAGTAAAFPNSTNGYGNYVTVTSGSYVSYYAHLTQISVSNGQQVSQGEIVGLSGYTGNIDPPGPAGAHLHFSIHNNGEAVMPEPMSGYTGFGQYGHSCGKPTGSFDPGPIPTGQITGRVYRSDTGAAVAGVQVSYITVDGLSFFTTTDMLGNFVLSIPVGLASLFASSSSGGGTVSNVLVVASTTKVVNIAISQTCSAAAVASIAPRSLTASLDATATSCGGGGSPTPTPLPSDGDIAVTNLSYPSTVSPGQSFVPQVTVLVESGQLLQSSGDMLRCNDPNCDNSAAVRFGAYPFIGVQGTVNTGQSYTFSFYSNYPITAPNQPGSYTSDWRIWRSGAWAGPNIPITFTVQQNGCTTAPTTASQVSGAIPGLHGWWRSSVAVTLTATSVCGTSGLQTHYSINSGSWTTYTAPIVFNQEGKYTLAYYSDGLGPAESTQTIQINIDWTPPVTTATATGPRDTNGIFRDDVTAGLQSTDNLSGVDYEQYSTDGGQTWTDMTGANNTFPISGEGVYRFLYRSVDIAGNVEQPHDSGPIIINKYTVFSNGSGQSLSITGVTGTSISGDMHSNGAVNISDNTDSTLGSTLTAVQGGNTLSDNTGVTLPPLTTGVAPVPMLAYPLSLYQQLATAYFPSDLYIDSVDTPINGILYSAGSIYLSAVQLGGSASFIAQNDIDDESTDSTFKTDDPHNGMLFYAGRNMTIDSTGSRALGLYYAPNGKVHIISTGLNIQGSLVGNQVALDGTTGLTLNYNPAFSNGTYTLPLAAMGAVAPTGTPPPLPSVPSAEGANKANNDHTATIFFWSNSANAVGYQIQVATDPSFSSGTIASDTCHLATDAFLHLVAGTTYYWRVQAINQAGYSGWSSTGTYTTPGSPTSATATSTSTATSMPPTSTATPTATPTGTATPSTGGATTLYSFEDGAVDGWQVPNPPLTGVSNSTAQAYDGTHSLALAATSFATTSYPWAQVLHPALSPGQTVTAHVWVPAGSSLAAQLFISDATYSWWMQGYTQLAPGAWNTLTYTVPATAAPPFYALGIQFQNAGAAAFTGTIYVDAVQASAASGTAPTGTATPAATSTSTPGMPQPTPAPTDVPAGAISLGGINLYGYCTSLGYAGNTLDGNTASDWHCEDAAGTRYAMDMTAACKWQNPNASKVAAYAGAQNNPTSWICYSLPGPTATPTGTATPNTGGAATLYSFEDGTADGWQVSNPPLTGVTNSTAQAYDGTHSLALAATSFATTSYPWAQVLHPALSPGQTVTARLWIPAGSAFAAQLFVSDATYSWWMQGYTQLAPGAWNTLTYTVPATAAPPFYALGIQFQNAGASPFTGTIYVDAVQASAQSTASPTPTASPTGAGSCPDIGNVSLPGTQSLDGNGVWTVSGAGGDWWDTADAGHLVAQWLAGDRTATACVSNLTNSDGWAKYGLMFRASTDPGAPFFGAFITPSNGLAVIDRTAQGAQAQLLASLSSVSAPVCLKVSRSGGTFAAAYSTDGGATWSTPSGATAALNMPDSVLTGMAVASHAAAAGSATFANVAITQP